MTVYVKVVMAALVANGLLAGVFFVFACAVSPALGRLDDRAYVESFRSINTTILNGWFLAVFLVAPAAAIVAAVLGGVFHHPSLWWVALAAVCAVLSFGITAAANVPLNDALGTALTSTESQWHEARVAFETSWNRWNVARAITSVGALTLLAVAATRSAS